MNIPSKLKAELAEWLDTYWKTYLSGDLDTWATFIKEDYYNIGGTKEEIWHSKEEILAYSNSIKDQMIGQAEVRNRKIEATPYGDHVMVNEFTDLYVKIDGEWSFYGPFRMSSLLEKTDTGWIALHQHGSYPDMKATEGEAFAADALRSENLRLQAAVDQRTAELVIKNKELEIESALERVRAVAMGMKSPDNMFQVCRVISYELSQFGIQGIRNVQTVIIQEKRKIYDCYQYFPAYQREILEHTEYLKNQVEGALVNRMLEAKDGYFEGNLAGQEFQEFRTHRKEENHLADPLMDGVDEIFYFFYSIGPGALGITLYQELSPDGLAILKRFHQVFSLAYSRFRDIEKAEAQAREAQIEAALERVRAETMAMHSSEDVGKCILKMFGELTALGVHEGTRFGIGILNHDNNNNQLWTARKDGKDVKMHIGNLDMNSHPLLKSARKAWKEQIPFHQYILEGKDLLDYYQMLNNAPDYKIQIAIEKLPKIEIQLCFIFEHGFFYAFSPHEFQPELIHTIQRFTSQFAQTYRRYLDLVMAEAQTREARIEAALEKVRSRSLAMHKSEELKEVIQVVYDQFLQLKIHIDHAGFIIDYKERDDMHIWLADHQQGVPTEITIPYFDSPHWNSFREAKANGDNFFANLLPFEVKNKFYRNIFELIPEVTEDAQQTIFSKPALAISTVLLDHVGLYMENYADTPFSDEENGILMRFGKVFEQAYTRFLDLQKAETQTRESQINLAVERVRATAMAMHQTSDLDKVNKEILNQLNWLQVPGLSGVTFYLIDENGWVKAWDFSSPGNMGEQNSYTLHYDSNRHEMLGFPFKILQQTDLNYFVADYPLEKLEKAVYELEEINPAIAKIVMEALSTGALTHQWGACCRISNGLLGIDLVIPPSEDTKTIGLKIAGAFNQAYIRFLDLQKAEAQAREAQIEAALERVRSRTMAMQSSEELADAAYVLFEQLNILGVTHERINIGIVDETSQSIDFWATEQGGKQLNTKFSGRISEPTTLSKSYQAWKKGAKSLVVDLQGEELKSWLQFMAEEIKIPFNKSFLHDRRVQTAGFFSKGMLVVTSPEPLGEEALYLLEKFAGVFDLTYTRFSDLKQAEAQAREAKIEVAMERIRTKALAMQSSTELSEVAKVLREQMGILGHEDLEASVVHLYLADSPTFESWYAFRAGDQIIEGNATFRLENSALAKEFLKLYEDEVTEYTMEVKGQKLEEWLAEIKRNAPKIAAYWGDLPPERQFYHFSDFSGGALLMVSHQDPTDETRMLQKRCASVFELAYKRFLDLRFKEEQSVKLAQEKQRLEITLRDLQDTQKQLIQSEKMASLGELTAGIAHEIQNPLNFVNNFSEVSNELIAEIEEERAKSQEARDETLVSEILRDVKENLIKISHHGKRADGIVKGMLEHSRKSEGTKTPTNLNGLADEFLRLSYHGLRAKDKSFNADFELDLDPNLPKVDVIPQDIGRVLLNLINNAFYAVNEKAKATNQSEDYKPTVKVSTSYSPLQSLSRDIGRGGSVQISISDNGPGIPDAIKDKIFQPFFTTKPTGQGTGLGLSLAYDIVKAHGGELKVETKEGQGITFIIQIPNHSS
ncbi:ATP-binding protein [Algoriphagus antarcticus]|uniref:histidine kinase n=1 Tax=Algoriphagus antarcticus TaxID=238540 RepID=A0A3E0DYF3_9BACT|nr:ATP-binding protein [Algoriphagus antarcticus]REG91082.1 phospho-acceptor domain-containing protein [Algoriphagus antarcticus]